MCSSSDVRWQSVRLVCVCANPSPLPYAEHTFRPVRIVACALSCDGTYMTARVFSGFCSGIRLMIIPSSVMLSSPSPERRVFESYPNIIRTRSAELGSAIIVKANSTRSQNRQQHARYVDDANDDEYIHTHVLLGSIISGPSRTNKKNATAFGDSIFEQALSF